MFARFDVNPAMTLRVIKETKRYGRTDNVKTVYPLQTKFARRGWGGGGIGGGGGGGYNEITCADPGLDPLPPPPPPVNNLAIQVRIS